MGEGDLPTIPKNMERPQIWHTPTKEEQITGYRVSDSEVMDAIKVLRMYATQTMDSTSSLYWDAKKKGQEEFANTHLKRYQNAKYIEMECDTITTFYKESK